MTLCLPVKHGVDDNLDVTKEKLLTFARHAQEKPITSWMFYSLMSWFPPSQNNICSYNDGTQ